MELDVKDVARMMDLPEITILRWIRQGKIPFYIKNGRYVFDEKQLISWAKMHNISLWEEPLKNKNKEEEITLYEAIKKGGIFFNIEGSTVNELLKNAVELFKLSSKVDKDFLFEKLIQREELCSTGIGEGVAIPHPRYPIKDLDPMVGVFFLKREIDFRAVDGKPVFVMFIILSPSTKIHLRFLSKLSFCLRNRDFLHFLKGRGNKEKFLNTIKELESNLDKTNNI